jgi:mannitol/fructose-specific phosphotransferase system IIA component (Ntr-type)
MAWMLKEFFDRTYNAARGRKEVFKKVYEPVIARGRIVPEILKACEKLGKTIAAGRKAGIY